MIKIKNILFRSMLLVSCFLFSIVPFLLYGQTFAETFYVATTGTDNVACGSTDSPCATVQYILARTPTVKLVAGDTIKVKVGTYTMTSGNCTGNAIGSHWIVFNDRTNHDNVTLTADDIANPPLFTSNAACTGALAVIEGAEGVTVSYLKFQYAPTRGTGRSQGVIQIRAVNTIIDNCEVSNGHTGISIETYRNVTISNCKIFGNGTPPRVCGSQDGAGAGIGIYNFMRYPAAAGWHEKIYIYNNEIYEGGEDGIINVNTKYKYLEYAYNNIYNNGEDGIDNKDEQYVKIHHNKIHDNCDAGINSNDSYPSHNLEIYNNEIYNNGFHGLTVQNFGVDRQNDWVIYNNLIYSNCKVAHPPRCTSPQTCWNCYAADLAVGLRHIFVNNTVYANNSDIWDTFSLSGNLASKGGMCKNNIFYNNGTGAGGGANGGGGDYNYCYPVTGGLGCGRNAQKTSDPGLMNPAGGDFRLTSSSVCKDAGTALGAPYNVDYIGTSRPQGNGWDIGAYEFVGVGNQP